MYRETIAIIGQNSAKNTVGSFLTIIYREHLLQTKNIQFLADFKIILRECCYTDAIVKKARSRINFKE